MRQFIIALFTVLLFLSENTLVPILLPDGFQQVYVINPHLTLIAIVMISLYLGSKVGLIYGLIFGALFDLSSTGITGLFLFAYGLVGNLAGALLRLLHRNIWLILTAVGASADLSLYNKLWIRSLLRSRIPFVSNLIIIPLSNRSQFSL